MYYDLVTAPGSEPVSLAEAKDHLLIDSTTTDFDTYITALIKAARKYIEKRTGYIVVKSTWALLLDGWPSNEFIFIGKKPVSAITKVEYLKPNETSYTELTSADFVGYAKHSPPAVYLKNKPTLESGLNSVKITFVAGHDTAVATDEIPEFVSQAIKILVRQMFENRQEEVTGTIVSKLDKGFEYLLQMAEIHSV